MKKVILATLVVFGLSINAFSQESITDDFIPSAGDASIEVNFLSPFVVGQPFTMDNLKGRYFLSNTMAVRLGLEFDLTSETDEGEDWESTDRVTDFGLYPGVEIHFPVSNRVSPYVGGEIGFFSRSTYYGENDVEVKNEAGFSSFHINLVSGVDLYIYKGLYLGAELGYGFERRSTKDAEYTIDNTTTEVENNDVLYRVGDNINASFRLGWSF